MKKYLFLFIVTNLIFGIKSFAGVVVPGDSVTIKTIEGKKYIVRKLEQGDGWYSVARYYGITFGELRAANKNLDEKLKLGETILVPLALVKFHDPRGESGHSQTAQPIYYTVNAKENLFEVAKKIGVSEDSIKRWNKLKSSTLKKDQELIVGYNTVMTASRKQKGRDESNEDIMKPESKTYTAKNEDNKESEKTADRKSNTKKSEPSSEDIKKEAKLADAKSKNVILDNKKTENKSEDVKTYTKKSEPVSPEVKTETKKSEPVSTETKKSDAIVDSKKDLPAAPDFFNETKKSDAVVEAKKTPPVSTETKTDVKKTEAPVAETKSKDNTVVLKTAVSDLKKPSTSTGKIRKEVSEQGVAEWVTDEDVNPNKFYALHRTAPVGTIIKVVNRMNNKYVYVKVVGTLPATGDNDSVLIKISKACADKVGVLDPRFQCMLAYGVYQ